MPATSKAQQQFFGLVRAVQKGEIPASKVTSNVRDAAKNTSAQDVEDFASTKTKNLPDKIIDKDTDKKSDKKKEESILPSEAFGEPEKVYGNPNKKLKLSPHFADPNDRKFPNEPEKSKKFRPSLTASPRNETMSFGDIVARYNEYGNILRRDKSLSELAQNLADIAEYAEFTLTNETNTNEWFDKYTIGRNIKEMKGYAKEFAKIAEEADEHNMRMSALYDDMGRVLERYFDIYDSSQEEPSDVEQMSEFTYEPQERDPAEVLTSRGEGFGVYDEEEEMDTDSDSDLMTERAIAYVRERLVGENLVRFDSLPEEIRNEVAWRALAKEDRHAPDDFDTTPEPSPDDYTPEPVNVPKPDEFPSGGEVYKSIARRPYRGGRGWSRRR